MLRMVLVSKPYLVSHPVGTDGNAVSFDESRVGIPE
jgi:hypothetical protein